MILNIVISHKTYQMTKFPKILIPKESITRANWNKHLPTPLKYNEKCIVAKDQEEVVQGYVKIKHGQGDDKKVSIFSINHFTDLSGNNIE